MRCRHAGTRLPDLRTGALPAAEAVEVRAHLAVCASCARQARLEAEVAADLARLRAPVPFEVRLEDRVMARIATIPRPRRSETSSGELLAWTAAASILGIGILVAFASQVPSAGLLWVGIKNLGSVFLAVVSSLPDAVVAIARFLRPLVEAGRHALQAVDSLWRLVEPAARLAVLTSLAGTTAIALYVLGRDLRPVALVKER